MGSFRLTDRMISFWRAIRFCWKFADISVRWTDETDGDISLWRTDETDGDISLWRTDETDGDISLWRTDETDSDISLWRTDETDGDISLWRTVETDGDISLCIAVRFFFKRRRAFFIADRQWYFCKILTKKNRFLHEKRWVLDCARWNFSFHLFEIKEVYLIKF